MFFFFLSPSIPPSLPPSVPKVWWYSQGWLWIYYVAELPISCFYLPSAELTTTVLCTAWDWILGFATLGKFSPSWAFYPQPSFSSYKNRGPRSSGLKYKFRGLCVCFIFLRIFFMYQGLWKRCVTRECHNGRHKIPTCTEKKIPIQSDKWFRGKLPLSSKCI